MYCCGVMIEFHVWHITLDYSSSDPQQMCRFCEQAKAEISGEPSLTEADLQSSRLSSAYATTGRVSPSLTAARSRSWSLTDALAVERCGAMSKSRVPVTVLTGFLGAGKTTVLQHILTSSHGKRLAVIENEFGEVSVDEDLLSMPVEQATGEAQVVLMPNGCLCCRARQDLVEAFQKVLEQATSNRPSHDGPCLDGLIVELSGLSEVGPVVQTFFSHPQVQRSLRLDAVVCVCDARALRHAMAATSVAGEGSMEVIGEQLSLSDRVLLNKLDLLEMECGDSSGQRLDDLRAFIRTVNPGAVVVECVRGEVPMDGLLGVNAFSLDRVVKGERRGAEGFVAQLEAEVEAVVGAAEGRERRNGGSKDVPCNGNGFRTSSRPPSVAAAEDAGAISASSLSPTTAMTEGVAHETGPRSSAPTHEHGEQHVDHDHHSHQSHHDVVPHSDGSVDHRDHTTGGPTHAHAHTGGDRKPLQVHAHVSLGYVSVGVRLEDGPLQWSEFEAWLARVLREQAGAIVRLKGVLWVTKRTTYRRSTIVQRRVVVQGVFGHVEDEDTGEWPTGTKPCTRLVLIGRLPQELQDELKRGIVKCLAPGYIATSQWAKRLVGR